MRKSLLWCTTLLAIAAAGPVHAQDDAREDATPPAIETHGVRLPGTDYLVALGSAVIQAPANARGALLTAIATWLATALDLPAVDRHPQIEIVPAARIAALRYRGMLPDVQTNFVPTDRTATPAHHSIV
jgi:hypothetical protein